MGLRAALVDRARISREEATATKVQGRTLSVPADLPWFRCRLELPEGAEVTDQGQGRKVSRVGPSLMYDKRDSSGEDVLLKPNHRLEVNSLQLGNEEWLVTSTPKPMRKKRKVIGWTVALKRVHEQERD